MTREDAYKFIRLYKQFQATGLKIVDFDGNQTELLIPSDKRYGPGTRVWRDDISAAKVIEANS